MKNLKAKTVFASIGIIAGIMLIVFGSIIILGGFGDAYGHVSYSGDYTKGYATFGGDFYTYSVNNTAQAASAASATNDSLHGISNLLCNSLGVFMQCFGLITICGFGIVFADCIHKITEINNKETNEENRKYLNAAEETENIILSE